MCIRDEHGACAFILAKTEWFTPRYEVHIGEALRLLSTLSWVHELQLALLILSWTQREWSIVSII
jgi:hypothetical protein